MIDLNNWIRKNTGATETYYGYAAPGTLTSDNKWLIRKETTDGSDNVYEYADNDFTFEKIWDNKELYFQAPSAVTISSSAVTNNTLIFSFDVVAGVSKYYVTVLDSSQNKVGSWNRQRVRSLNNSNITIKIDQYLSTASTYTILIECWNMIGNNILTLTMTTS
jgi:hypothetical protein